MNVDLAALLAVMALTLLLGSGEPRSHLAEAITESPLLALRKTREPINGIHHLSQAVSGLGKSIRTARFQDDDRSAIPLCNLDVSRREDLVDRGCLRREVDLGLCWPTSDGEVLAGRRPAGRGCVARSVGVHSGRLPDLPEVARLQQGWTPAYDSHRHGWHLDSSVEPQDIDAALRTLPVIYWRVPQFFEQLKAGDSVLIWRSGKKAGIVGWGVLLSDPRHYDLSGDDDPFAKSGFPREENDWYVPVRVWGAPEMPKQEVAEAIPDNRIVTAPMGTVFRLGADEVSALRPLLDGRDYDLTRPATTDVSLLPVLPEIEGDADKKKERQTPVSGRATITPAMFLLSSTPDRPVEITIEGDSLRLSLLERDALRALDEDWDAVGVYLLLGRPVTEDAVLSVYVGKAQGLRSRIRTGHALKEWTRCLVVQREGLHAFNASDISWLERRLLDVLLEAPDVDVINKTPPPPEVVPDYKAEILERDGCCHSRRLRRAGGTYRLTRPLFAFCNHRDLKPPSDHEARPAHGAG
jgi:hypothetical protein